MIISVKDLRKNPSLLDQLDRKPQQCANCKVPLQEAITGKRRTDYGELCSDCYYELAGQIVEDSPIVTARVRRG